MTSPSALSRAGAAWSSVTVRGIYLIVLGQPPCRVNRSHATASCGCYALPIHVALRILSIFLLCRLAFAPLHTSGAMRSSYSSASHQAMFCNGCIAPLMLRHITLWCGSYPSNGNRYGRTHRLEDGHWHRRHCNRAARSARCSYPG